MTSHEKDSQLWGRTGLRAMEGEALRPLELRMAGTTLTRMGEGLDTKCLCPSWKQILGFKISATKCGTVWHGVKRMQCSVPPVVP